MLFNTGGLLTLIVLSEKSLDAELRNEPKKEFFLNLTLQDWEYQS